MTFRYVAKGVTYAVVGLVTVVACVLVRPFKLIRFGHLYTSRIGHLIYNLDNYLSARRERGSRELAVFSTDAAIANETVLSLWRRDRNLVFSPVAKPAMAVLRRLWPGSPHLISYPLEMNPVVSAYSASAPNTAWTAEEERSGEELLARLGITRPLVTLHNRDSAYLGRYGSDGNRHDFRDFDFDDLRPGIQQLLDRGYTAVRMGKVVERAAAVTHPRFVSLTEEKRTDFADVYVVSASAFFVGCNTGFSNIPRMFRQPELLVNFIPFKPLEFWLYSAGSIVIPKKLYSEEAGRFLRFAEMASLPYDIHYQGDFFGDRRLGVVNNSEAEIAAAILEMEARVAGRWSDSEAQASLQSEFWASLGDSPELKVVRYGLGSSVSSSFLEANQDLI